MSPISPAQKLPVQAQSIRPSRSGTEPPTQSEAAQTVAEPDRLSPAPNALLHNTAEWLLENEMLSLMQASSRLRTLVKQYYSQRLQAGITETDPPARRYRKPVNRTDRALTLDHTGREHLTSLGIHFPLTAQIASGKLKVQQALALVQERRCMLQATLGSAGLTEHQMALLRNPLFEEHVLCGRCDIGTAVRLARLKMAGFYSLSLQHLFRSGALEPADLETISGPALRLVHDPLLVDLVQDGLIRKRDLLRLTQTQFESILMFRTLLMSKKLQMREVLALEESHVGSLRRAGLLDDVADGRIRLSDAHELITKPGVSTDALPSNPRAVTRGSVMTPEQAKIRRMVREASRTAVSDSLFSVDGPVWLEEFGLLCHHLSVDTIMKLMDTSDHMWPPTKGEHPSAFAGFSGGFATLPGAQQAANAYVQVYINLAGHLGNQDYLRAVRPFLNHVFGLLVSEGCNGEFHTLVEQCTKIWTLVQAKCVLSATSVRPLRNLVMPLLKESILEVDFIGILEKGNCLAAFARLLTVMDLHDDEDFFELWGASSEEPHYTVPACTLHCLHALFSPYETSPIGSANLKTIAAAIKYSRQS